MAEEGNMMSIIIVWRGKQLNVVMNQSSTLEEFGLTLQKLTNVKPDTMRLLVPRSTNRSSKLLTPFSNEHSKFSLQELDILEGKSIKMMGSFAYEVEEILQNSSKDLRIAGFEEEEKRLMQRKLGAPQTFLKLPQGPYIFREFRTLQIPGIELNPPATEALQRMHTLASDPGIVAIMNKHRWTVGIMTELAPVGYVGVSPKCILGLNKNHGEEISLRLRTDDLKGFRKYESIKKTLLHELAHMVYSEHDDDFFTLDRQLNKEAESLDWTKSKGNSLGGLKFAGHNDMEEFNIGASHARKLGGGTSDLIIDARANSVEAAYRRLLNSSIDSSTDLQVESIEVNSHGFLNYESGIDRKLKFEHKTFGEPDPDDSRANDDIFEHKSMFEPDPNDSQENLDVPSETSMEIEKISGAEQCDEPDPDDSNRIEYEQASEPDPDDSEGGRAVQYNPYMRINGKPHPHKVISGNILGYNMDEPDPDECQAIDAMDEPDPDNPEEAVLKHRNMFKPVSNYSKEDKPGEAEPDPDENMVEPDPDDSQAIEASVESHLKVNKELILEKSYKEPDPDDCEFREATFETDSDDYKQNKTVEFEPDPDDAVEKPLLSLPISESSDVKIDESNEKVNEDSLRALELASADQELQRIHDPVSIICARIQKAIEILKSEATPLEATSVLQTLYKIIRNVIEHPDELKFKRLRKANPTFQRNVANYKAAIEVLHAIGFYEDIICDEIGKREAYLVLKRNDPALLWLAKSSLEQLCIA